MQKNIIFFLIVFVLSGSGLIAQESFDLEAEKKAFAWKKRRIITNNDGLDAKINNPSDTLNPLTFLDRRVEGLRSRNTQVDAISYCDGLFNSYTHRSNLTESKTDGLRNEFLTEYLFKIGTDPLTEVIKYGKENDIDVFWSYRVNDTHDSHDTTIMSDWKSENPEALMGDYNQKFEHLDGWSALNYDSYKTRKRALEIIEDVVANYDIDGVELDFFKHLLYFPETLNGGIAREDQIELMTAFVHDVRQILDSYSKKRKKPLLLLIRTPDSFQYCRDLGIDVEEWIKKDYADIWITNDYFKLNSYEFLARVSKLFDIPVYACLTPRRIHGGGTPGTKSDLLKWRAEAYAALSAGVTGIYVFNRFPTWDSILKEIGDLETLQNSEKTEGFETYICDTCWWQPKKWLKGGNKYLKTGDAYLDEKYGNK